jgi:segregation and condensation protein B
VGREGPFSDNHELDLPSKVEALLFVADEPVSVQQLAQALGVTQGGVASALEQLREQCEKRGLRLQRKDRLVQLVTAPGAADYVRRFLGLDIHTKLSTAALETLALVAYQQPATRAQVEAIRGVNCDSVLRTLLSRGLVVAQGRLDQAGRPIIYGTTFEFLQHFGLADLGELPAFEELGSATGGGEENAPGRAAVETAADQEV